MCDLTKKVAIVTGSTSGIGLCIAKALSQSGASVMLNSVHSKEKGEQLTNEIPNTSYTQASIAIEDDCKRIVQNTLDQWGKLDILINNAGISKRIPHIDLNLNTDDVFQEMWQTNFMGTWYLSRLAMPYLQNSNPGHIINISSIAGTRATGSSIPYGVSKAAVNHLTKLLANSFSDQVRINAVAPGLVITPRTENWDDSIEYFTEKTATRRAGQPEDIAKVTLGILSSDYISGQIIEVDGGFLLG